MRGGHALAVENGVRVIGIPASIDNDIGCTSLAIGVDTALNTIVEACDKISDTARAHRRAFVVEVMGRESGYLAMAAAVAAGADAVLFREQARSEEEVIAAVEGVIRHAFEADRGKRQVLVIKAEGVPVPCTKLVREVDARLSDLGTVDCRAVVLGHLVRGGSPSYLDRLIAGRMGLMAVEAILEGAKDEMVAWRPTCSDAIRTADTNVGRFPLERVLSETDAMHDGSSPVTQRRLALIEAVEGVLAL